MEKDKGYHWNFYNYPNGETRLNVIDVAMIAGIVGDKHKNVMVATTVGWYYAYCLYLLRNKLRMEETKLEIELRYQQERYVRHCVNSIL